jgi:hypothetical protein
MTPYLPRGYGFHIRKVVHDRLRFCQERCPAAPGRLRIAPLEVPQ